MAMYEVEMPVKAIARSEIARVGYSGDDVGYLFTWQGRLFRAIHPEYEEHVKRMLSCGLLPDLMERRLVPRTWIADVFFDDCGLVLEHEYIHPITYPHEWSFRMLRDAGLAVLDVNLVAKKYGYQTKDSHPFNVVFDNAAPLFVDIGSFFPLPAWARRHTGWLAYEEFRRSYEYPLKIWASGNSWLARRLFAGRDLMPSWSYGLYNNSVLRYIWNPIFKMVPFAWYRYKQLPVAPEEWVRNHFIRRAWLRSIGNMLLCLRKRNLLPFSSVNLDHVRARLSRVANRKASSFWQNYHLRLVEEGGAIKPTPRFERLAQIVGDLGVEQVVEVGGNAGAFSMILLKQKRIRKAICTDYDDGAIDVAYRLAQQTGAALTPAVVDYTWPLQIVDSESPDKRFNSDLVIALALFHHLVLAQNVPIELAFQRLAAYTRKYSIVEFMPRGLWDGKTAPIVPSWYTQEWFHAHFARRFDVMHVEHLEENRIAFVGRKKGGV